MPRSTLPPRGVELPTAMIYRKEFQPYLSTWAQLRGLAWGTDTTPKVTMNELMSLTERSQSTLYEHMRFLRAAYVLSWQMAGKSTFIFSFPSNDEINSRFSELPSSLNTYINPNDSEEVKRDIADFIPEFRNKSERQRATKVTIPAEVLRPIVDALAEVTVMDKALNYGRLAKEAKDLHLAGYTPDQIRKAYGPNGAWWAKDWRGQKNETPAIGIIRQTIQGLLNGNGNGNHAQPVETVFDRLRKEREAANA